MGWDLRSPIVCEFIIHLNYTTELVFGEYYIGRIIYIVIFISTLISCFFPEVETDLVVQRDDGLSKYYTSYDRPGRQVLLLYGTEYGFSEEVARKLFDRMMETESLQSLAIQPRVLNCKYFERLYFTKENVVLCVFSTTGDGTYVCESMHVYMFVLIIIRNYNLSNDLYFINVCVTF